MLKRVFPYDEVMEQGWYKEKDLSTPNYRPGRATASFKIFHHESLPLDTSHQFFSPRFWMSSVKNPPTEAWIALFFPCPQRSIHNFILFYPLPHLYLSWDSDRDCNFRRFLEIIYLLLLLVLHAFMELVGSQGLSKNPYP